MIFFGSQTKLRCEHPCYKAFENLLFFINSWSISSGTSKFRLELVYGKMKIAAVDFLNNSTKRNRRKLNLDEQSMSTLLKVSLLFFWETEYFGSEYYIARHRLVETKTIYVLFWANKDYWQTTTTTTNYNKDKLFRFDGINMDQWSCFNSPFKRSLLGHAMVSWISNEPSVPKYGNYMRLLTPSDNMERAS